MTQNNANNACPCGSKSSLAHCCLPLLNRQKQAATALSLMRSRYSAFTLKNTAYLLATWHSDTRPKALELEHDTQQWIRLKIIDTLAGQVTDNTGEVEFIATYKIAGKAQRLHERSRFSRQNGEWRYVDDI